jgi:hypothetical protein
VIVPKTKVRSAVVHVWENVILVHASSEANAKKQAVAIGRLHARRSDIDANIEFHGVRAIVDVLPSPTGRARWNEVLESGCEVACNKMAFGSRAQFLRFMKLSRAATEVSW